ncbi:hypothetical protein BKA93DRAFT_878069 [Sparassis latifolia]
MHLVDRSQNIRTANILNTVGCYNEVQKGRIVRVHERQLRICTRFPSESSRRFTSSKWAKRGWGTPVYANKCEPVSVRKHSEYDKRISFSGILDGGDVINLAPESRGRSANTRGYQTMRTGAQSPFVSSSRPRFHCLFAAPLTATVVSTLQHSASNKFAVFSLSALGDGTDERGRPSQKSGSLAHSPRLNVRVRSSHHAARVTSSQAQVQRVISDGRAEDWLRRCLSTTAEDP